MDAVLPLLGRDVERVRRLLLPTLVANARGLSRLLVVLPDADHAAASHDLAGDRPFTMEFLRESEVVPEERLFLLHRKGWWLQQLIKLALHDRVRGPFYLTLDCDLICCRIWDERDLVVDGRAVLERDTLRPGQNLGWYEQASKVLDLPIPQAGMSVTPVVYSKDVVAGLARHLQLKVPATRRAAARLLPGWRGRALAGWRYHLRRSIPWTEMSLYATYLDGMGLLSRYHREVWGPTLYGNNVWTREQFDRWSVEDSLDQEFLFSVVGSKAGASVQEVVDKLSGKLPVA